MSLVLAFKKFLGLSKPILEGDLGIDQVGHRRYVGGHWDEIGKLQFDFMLERGLKPNDVFMDIACGSLRAGVHLIPYLDAGNYLGIEKEESLVKIGIEKELGDDAHKAKSPEFVISNSFEFEKFSKKPNFAIAQSLFTHLPPSLINLCFQNLKNAMEADGQFFATFFIGKKKMDNPDVSHDHDIFRYTKDEVIGFGEANGWDADFIGDWNHPRNQQMARYTLKQ